MFYKIAKNFFRILTHLFFRIEEKGALLEPLTGPVIICSNHISMIDPVFVASPLKREINFMAKKEVFSWPIVKWIAKGAKAFPVDTKKNDISALKTAIKILKSGGALGIFPEGTRVTDDKSVAAKAGIAMIAHRTKASIFPVHIICKGRVRFFKKISVVYGNPIPYESLGFQEGTQEEYKKVSEFIFERILSLGGTQ